MGLSLPTMSERAAWLSSLTREQKTQLDRLLCDGSLRDFIRQAWRIVEPGRRVVWNWHVDAISEHLEAVTNGQIRKLVINIPRRHMKSLAVAVFWPAWAWTTKPETRWLFGSHSLFLCGNHSRLCRQVVESTWYRGLWGNVFSLTSDQNQKTYFENDKRGYRLSRSVGASAIGSGGDLVVADDPHDPQEVESEVQRMAVLNWWDGVMASSVMDPEKSAHVLIMQRVHHKDLTGHLLEQGGYDHLCLPSEFNPQKRCVTSLGVQDNRTEPNELLFEKRFPQKYIDDQKIRLGSYRFAGQHLQNPSPLEGGLVKRHWWRFWHKKDEPLKVDSIQLADGKVFQSPIIPLPSDGYDLDGKPTKAFNRIIQTWDLSFKDTKDSAYVAGQVIACRGSDRFMLDQVREKMDFTATLKAIREMSAKWPDATEKLVEDKANGPAVISSLKHELSGIIAVEPQGGKESRAQAVLPEIEAGNVYLPHPNIAPWVNDYIEEWAAAPFGDYWDQIDATSQALLRLRQRKVFVHI